MSGQHGIQLLLLLGWVKITACRSCAIGQCPDQGCCVPFVSLSFRKLDVGSLLISWLILRAQTICCCFFLQSSRLFPVQDLLEPLCCKSQCCFQQGAGVQDAAWPGKVRRGVEEAVSPPEMERQDRCRGGKVCRAFPKGNGLHLTIGCCLPARQPGRRV